MTKKPLQLALAGVFAALVFLATYILQIPAGTGYLNAGDGVILLAAVWLGYPAAIPAALGSALADIAGGDAIFAPATALIKAAMALLAVFIIRITKNKLPGRILAFCLAEAVMITGYFLYETIIYGFAGAPANIGPNALQAAAGIALGTALSTMPKPTGNINI